MREEIAENVHAIFAYALNVIDQGKHLKIEEVQGELKRLLGVDLKLSTESIFGGDLMPGSQSAIPSVGEPPKYLGIRYPLVCWLDEVFLHDSPWQDQWNEQKLEWLLYRNTSRAWKFWEQAQLADGRLDNDALEVFLLCVALGFRGTLYDQPEQLAEWMKLVRRRLPKPGRRPTPTIPVSESHSIPAHASRRWSQGWLWQLLSVEEERNIYPEVDAAWAEAMQGLRDEDIDHENTPLFLLIGRPTAGERAFFDAAFLAEPSCLQVCQVPNRADSPIHVFATKDAIYVTCPGLLGEPTKQVAKGSWESVPRMRTWQENLMTIGAARFSRSAQSANGSPCSVGQRHRLPRRSIQEAVEIVRAQGRLRRLCRLIRDREADFPLRGILFLTPYAATESDEATTQAAQYCRDALAIVRETVGIHCPTFTVVCDMEQAPGFTNFLSMIPRELRHSRFGQSWQISGSDEDIAKTLEQGVSWLCQEIVPDYMHQFWQMEPTLENDIASVFRENRLLHSLWCQIRSRRDRFIQLAAATAMEIHQGPRIGGFYLAATGLESQEKGFVGGVVQKLFDHRKNLSWTQEALAKEEGFKRWSLLAHGALTALIVMIIALVVFA